MDTTFLIEKFGIVGLLIAVLVMAVRYLANKVQENYERHNELTERYINDLQEMHEKYNGRIDMLNAEHRAEMQIATERLDQTTDRFGRWIETVRDALQGVTSELRTLAERVSELERDR